MVIIYNGDPNLKKCKNYKPKEHKHFIIECYNCLIVDTDPKRIWLYDFLSKYNNNVRPYFVHLKCYSP